MFPIGYKNNETSFYEKSQNRKTKYFSKEFKQLPLLPRRKINLLLTDSNSEENKIKANRDLLEKIGIQVNEIFKKYDMLYNKIENNYESKLFQITYAYQQNILYYRTAEDNQIDMDLKNRNKRIIELEKEYQRVIIELDNEKKEEKNNLESEYNIDLREIAKEFMDFQNENTYQNLDNQKNDLDRYYYDIYNENYFKLQAKKFKSTEKMKEIFTTYLEYFIPKYFQFDEYSKDNGIDHFLYSSFKNIKNCIKSKSMKNSDIRSYYCGMYRYNKINSDLCKMFRELYMELTFSEMMNLWKKLIDYNFIEIKRDIQIGKEN